MQADRQFLANSRSGLKLLFRFERTTNSLQLRLMSRVAISAKADAFPWPILGKAMRPSRSEIFKISPTRRVRLATGGSPIGRYAKSVGLLLRQNVGKFTKIGRERRIAWKRGTCDNHDKSPPWRRND
jgi:hypothetical protein